jgi:hypothetical protein
MTTPCNKLKVMLNVSRKQDEELPVFISHLISGSSKPHGKSQPCFENSDPYDLALYF